MKTTGHWLCAMLVSCSAIATAQSAAPADLADTRIDTQLRALLAPVFDSARMRGLPAEPLTNKALEGVSKHAAPDRIVVAVRRLATDMGTARDALGTAASSAELVAGASAIKAGVPPVSLTQIAMACRHGSQRSLVVSLAVLSELIARGVPADTAASTMLALAQRGAQDEELVAFREDVEREIATGILPGVAAVAGIPAPAGIVASTALSGGGGHKPNAPNPAAPH